MKRRIPYAIGSFAEIIDGDYYFIDKTPFLRELEQYKVPVFLRPRRFGKSLWCSLLECYYDINRRDAFDTLFGGLAIGAEPTPLHNQFMVMRFNYSKIEVLPEYAMLRQKFNSECANSFAAFFANYAHLLDELPCGDAAETLAALLGMIKNRRLPPVYLIIDEYDNFTNQLVTTHQDALYREVTSGDSFLRTFFKVIKAGVEDQSIGRVFITGVLPITIDDLTSGFNIAEVITLAPNTLSMLGFTQAEVDGYVAAVFEEYGFDPQLRPQILTLLRDFYNGYAFTPRMTDRLYNSTIVSYFLKAFVINGGVLPDEFIDENLRTDVGWIKRLASGEQPALAMLERILLENELPYDEKMLRSKFNMEQFFERDFYPVSLFYLGMLTIKNQFRMMLPNQTMQAIFTEYFNTLARIEVSHGYVPYFEQFLIDLDLEALFTGYWDVYVKQIPAQVFEKMNENFFRTTFFELCSRYLSRDFTFGVEVNHLSGRSDWEMTGKPDSTFRKMKFLLEFKYVPIKEARKRNLLRLTAPLPEDVAQVAGYARDIRQEFPAFALRPHLVYIVGRKGFKMFRVDEHA